LAAKFDLWLRIYVGYKYADHTKKL